MDDVGGRDQMSVVETFGGINSHPADDDYDDDNDVWSRTYLPSFSLYLTYNHILLML